MRNKRQEMILELIGKYDIETQEELALKLEKCGFSVTQATVSRDIRALHLVKGASALGGYKYVLPKTPIAPAPPKIGNAVAESIIKVDCAGNLVVVKTFPGMAQPVASLIDSINSLDIVGCVAGDDSILVVVRDDERAPFVASYLQDAMRSR